MRVVMKRIIAIALAAILFSELPMCEYTSKAQAETAIRKTDDAGEVVSGSAADVSQSDGGQEYNYVSEIRLFQANSDNMDQIKEQAEKDGWIIAEEGDTPIDLNQYTGRDDIILGYKTSKNAEDAITDIKMLEMGHGYQWFDYQRVAESQMDKLEGLAADIGTASAEFSEKVSDGSRSAQYAKDYLNFLYFTDSAKSGDGKTLLGDYFSSGSIDTQVVKKMLVRMNGGSLTALFSYLALGVSDTDKTWVERINDSETFVAGETTSSQAKMMDRAYYEYSVDLLPKLQEFAQGYRSAQSHKNGQNSVALPTVEGENGNDEDINQENVQDLVDEGNSNESSGDIIYETAYQMLNKYSVGSEAAGDYLVRLAERSYSSRSDYRALYPVVEALTDGQYGMIKVVGVAQMALYLNRSEDFYRELDSKKESAAAKIAEAKQGATSLSIWEGVNTEFYEREVAMTSDAYRENQADTVYTDLTREGEFYDTMNLVMTYVSLAGSVGSVISGCIYLGILITGAQVTVWSACVGAIGSGVFATIGGMIGCASVVLGYVALAAVIIAGIVYLVKWVVDQFSDADKEDYTQMPAEIYDLVKIKNEGKDKRAYIKYLPVCDDSGNPKDVNADDGKRWNLLYYTKNKDICSPLVVDKEGKAFVRTVDNPSSPGGSVGVKTFGEKSAANLNSYVRQKETKSIYLHFATVDSLAKSNGVIDAGGAGDENQGEEISVTDSIDEDCYLYSLMVSHESSESAAKAAITKKPGFRVFDKNLSPDGGYTYIGFSTTKFEEEALRDVRIVPNYSSDVHYGGASYSLAGRLDDGSGLVYTRYKSAGSPIYGGLMMDNKILPKESVYEPINMPCGGNAYNLNLQFRGKSPIYLYFKPSVAYTSGKEYLAGIQFVSVRKGYGTKDTKQFIEELGVTDFGVKMLSFPICPKKDSYGYMTGGQWGMPRQYLSLGSCTYDDYDIRMCYTTTYNPYRAIYDIGVYTATTKIDTLQSSIQSTKGVYTVAETLLLSNEACLDAALMASETNPTVPSGDEKVRIAGNHSYIHPPKARSVKQQYKIEDNITWNESEFRLQSLYLLGPVEGASPIEIGDIKVTTDPSTPSGMHSIKRFTDPYAASPVDISYRKDDNSNPPVYVFLKGEEKAKPKYISSIEVASYDRPKDTDKKKYSEEEIKAYDSYSDDQCRMELISKVTGEIYNCNIGLNQDEAWYRNPETKNAPASYIGVNRTDDVNHAITGIIMLKSYDKPDARIKVNGVEYHRSGVCMNGYYFYYTKSPGANPGLPITDLTFDNKAVGGGITTVPAIDKPDSDGKPAVFSEDIKGNGVYIHMKADTDEGIISDISIVKAQSRDKLMIEMMKDGYNYLVDENLNYKAGGENLYLVYKMCSASALKKVDAGGNKESSTSYESSDDEDWSDFDFDFDFDNIVSDDKMVRDIICTVGQKPDSEITHNGVKYKLLSDISLNEGTGGQSLYLYYTNEETLTIDGKQTKLSPLSGICLCSGNAVPYKSQLSSEFGIWEELLDTDSQVVDVNSGVISKTDKGRHVQECRLYLFTHRYDQGVKPGAEIKRGSVKKTFTMGDLYLAD